MAAAAIHTRLADVTQQAWFPTVQKHMWEMSPFSRNIVRSQEKPQRLGLGDAWRIRRAFMVGSAGNFQHGSALGPTNSVDAGTTGSPYGTIFGAGATRWNLPTSAPAYFTWYVTLQQGTGNIKVPHEVFRLPQKSLVDAYGDIMSAAAMMNTREMLNSFWAESATIGSDTLHDVLGTFTGDNAGVAPMAVSAAFTLTSGKINRLYDGQFVELWYSNSGTATRLANTTNALYMVTQVNPLANTFKLVNVSANPQTPTEVTHYIVKAGAYQVNDTDPQTITNSTYYGPHSIERLLATSGTIYGDSSGGTLNLATHPRFQSYVQTHSGTLSELTLNEYLGRCEEALNGVNSIDTLVGNPGVFIGMIDEFTNFTTVERNGEYLRTRFGHQIQGDGTFGTLTAFGRTYRLAYDSWCSEGKLLGLKTAGSNLKWIMPPKMDRTSSAPGFDAAIEFIGPITGNNIFMPITSSDQITSAVQAPYYFSWEFLPDQIPGMKISGITPVIGPLNS